MIPCACGGSLYRHQRGILKRTKEEYQRFYCQSCGATMTFYRKDNLHWTPEKRGVGKACCDDTEFMDAIKRVHGQEPAVASGESKGNGQVDLHLVKRQPKQTNKTLRVV